MFGSSSVKVFFKYFLPPFVLLLAFGYSLHRANLANETERTYLAGLNQLEVRRANIVNLITPLVSNTVYISGSKLLNTTDFSEQDRVEIIEDLVYFAKTHPFFEQVRILGPEGRELLRVNDYNDSVRVVEDSMLQLKVGRGYFQQALQLDENEVYITKMELNREFDSIDRPYHTIIRIISRISSDKADKATGYFITNVSVENLISEFFVATHQDSLALFLLTSEVEGVFAHDGDFEYIFKDLPKPKLPKDSLTKLKVKLENADYGHWQTSTGMYVFKRLSLVKELTERPSLKALDFKNPQDSDLLMVTFITAPQLNATIFLSRQNWWLLLGLLVLCAMVSVLLTVRETRESKMYLEISVLNDELIESQHALNMDRQKLESTVAELTGRNHQLREFSQIISHNIRSPIAGLTILVDYLAKQGSGLSPGDLHEMVDKLKHSAQTLNDLTDDLLEVVNVFNKRELPRAQVDLRKVIDKSRDILMEQIVESGATIEVNLQAWQELSYNRYYLESIVLNLLSNAIKYRSPERPLKIGIETATDGNGGKLLTFRDNGRGINLGWHGDNIFGLHKTFHRDVPGKGLGLFMTKTQINSMGGTIAVESEEGVGTTFTITF